MRVIGIIALLIAGLFMVRALRALWIISKIPSRPGLVKKYGGRYPLMEKAKRLAVWGLILAVVGSALLFRSCVSQRHRIFYRCKFRKKLE